MLNVFYYYYEVIDGIYLLYREIGKLLFADGSIVLYECVTDVPHAMAAGGMLSQLSALLGAHCAGGIDPRLTCIPDNWSKQPDIAMFRIGKANLGLKANEAGAAWPNIIVEVRFNYTFK